MYPVNLIYSILYKKLPGKEGVKGRYEFIIIMPMHHRGLLYFEFEAKNCIDSICEENIINQALAALNKNRNITKEYDIRLPDFKIETNMSAKKYFRKVI